ncbi:hypothetical protein K0M31_018688, partial [Melipona bicolor]
KNFELIKEVRTCSKKIVCQRCKTCRGLKSIARCTDCFGVTAETFELVKNVKTCSKRLRVQLVEVLSLRRKVEVSSERTEERLGGSCCENCAWLLQ